jgi:phosphoribosylanthranilate isomerase
MARFLDLLSWTEPPLNLCNLRNLRFHDVVLCREAQHGEAMIPVKICGITRAQDAEAAVRCGARALGFILWPRSPRYVTPDDAARIVAGLPPFVVAVGVFVAQPVEAMNAIAARCRLDRIQLHGGEPHGTLAALARPGWRVFRLKAEADVAAVLAAPDRTVHLDAFHEQLVGGTGQTADWAWARRLAEAKTVILAGGIGPGNAADAVRAAHPAALDVNSGVESAPGIKDPAKIEALFRALESLPVEFQPRSDRHAFATP